MKRISYLFVLVLMLTPLFLSAGVDKTIPDKSAEIKVLIVDDQLISAGLNCLCLTRGEHLYVNWQSQTVEATAEGYAITELFLSEKYLTSITANHEPYNKKNKGYAHKGKHKGMGLIPAAGLLLNNRVKKNNYKNYIRAKSFAKRE